MPNGRVFCSTIIPTVNRPTLGRAVESVLHQQFARAEFQVIIVNDSGQPLRHESWLKSPRVRVIDTNRRERSVARNAGAAIARGEHLHFLDDDDVILPGAMEALWQLGTNNPDAGWLYGGYEVADNAGIVLREYFPDLRGNIFGPLVAGEHIPLQASLLRTSDFFGAGAFDAVITSAEDTDLERRMALRVSVVCGSVKVARIRIGEEGSTMNWSTLAENNRRGRDKALSTAGCYSRLRMSSTSPYWRGRAARACVASAVWNLKQHQPLTSLERVIAALGLSGARTLRPGFWQGVTTPPGQGEGWR